MAYITLYFDRPWHEIGKDQPPYVHSYTIPFGYGSPKWIVPDRIDEEIDRFDLHIRSSLQPFDPA